MDVKILLLGDAGVGKSSLLSSYASDRFPDPDSIPQILANVKVPPELNANGNNVTIQDSGSSLGADREVLKSKIKSSNSIIALYDSTRLETLDSLFNEWLPLVRDTWFGTSSASSSGGEASSSSSVVGSASFDKDSLVASIGTEGTAVSSHKYSNKAVILCATKIDLLDESDSIRADEELQKVNSIISSFPFISACCRSSAKLLNVGDTFYYADMVVSFPIQPLYDSSKGDFKLECKRALTRICRVYDSDSDGFLVNKDLVSLQAASFNNQLINDEDIVAMKKQAAACTPGCISSKGMSYGGFIGYLRLYVDKSKPIVPWTIIKSHDYNSKLVLEVPSHVNIVPRPADAGAGGGSDKISMLTDNAKRFLKSIAAESCSSCQSPLPLVGEAGIGKEVFLNDQSIQSIFSVMSPSELKDVPWVAASNYSSSGGNSYIFREGLESMYVLSNNHKRIFSEREWLSQWEMLALVNPSLTQNLLFRIGYARRGDLGTAPSLGRLHSHDASRKRKRGTYRLCILGAPGVGKTSLLSLLSGSLQKPYSDSNGAVTNEINGYFVNHTNLYKEHTKQFVSSYANAQIVTKKIERRRGSDKSSFINSIKSLLSPTGRAVASDSAGGDSEGNTITTIVTDNICVIMTKIPHEKHEEWLSRNVNSCDLAILLFNCNDHSADSGESTFEYAKRIEATLPQTTPRFYVGNKVDAVLHDGVLAVSLDAVDEHIAAMELQPLLKVSCSQGNGLSDCAHRVLGVLSDRTEGLPLLKKQLRQRRKHLAIAAVSVSALVLSGLGIRYYTNRGGSSGSVLARVGGMIGGLKLGLFRR